MRASTKTVTQLRLVPFHPPGETEIVVLRGDPARARSGQHLPVLRDVDLRVGAVDLFRYDHVPRQPRDFRKPDERHRDRPGGHPTTPHRSASRSIRRSSPSASIVEPANFPYDTT